MLIYLIRLFAALALFVGLFLDARQQPASSYRLSEAGCLVRGGYARVSRARPPYLVVTQTASGLVIRESDLGPEASTRLVDPAGDIQYFILPRWSEKYWGLWALTDYTVSLRLDCITDYPHYSYDPPPSHIRTAVAVWLRDNGWIDPTVCAKASVADVRFRRTIPGGWTHTLLALSLLAIALTLCPWRDTSHLIGRWFAKPRPGLCDECGYDLTGLRSDTCPECGEPLLHPVGSLSDLNDTGASTTDATPPR